LPTDPNDRKLVRRVQELRVISAARASNAVFWASIGPMYALRPGAAFALYVPMNAESQRLLLLAQHERLRDRVAACTRLARLFREGQSTGRELDAALDALRAEFSLHNETETAVISKLLHGPSRWGTALIDRMLEEHVAEHAAFWELLSGTRDEMASRIDELADDLDAHMAAEERTFLAPVTLRDDVIAARTRDQ
jgi:iron-sulfur cluster repair protein YtfE (RIC family)